MNDPTLRPSRFHLLEPDYTRPVYKIPGRARIKILSRLNSLYGGTKAARFFTELERVMRVYYAHKTTEMIEWEKGFDPDNRFTERDAILITYGDLIRDDNQMPLETLAELSRKYLKNVFNTLHILPFFPSSSDRGFAIRDFRQVDPNLGTWENINSIKDDFRLMFDGVFNHISSKSFWFQEFLNGNPDYRDFFTVYAGTRKISSKKIGKLVRPRTSSVLTPVHTIHGEKLVWTTFSPDQIDLKFQNPRVLIKMVEILLIYVRRGADIIRLDAVTYLWDELGTTGAHLSQTHTIIRLFRDILNAVAPHVALITETNVPHGENISYFGNGFDEAQMVYNFALPPLVLHTFISGNSERLTKWAEALISKSRRTTFLNFLDSHDGIGLSGALNILSSDEMDSLVDSVLKSGGYVSNRTDRDGKEIPYELNITFYSALNREDSGEDEDMQIRRYCAARSIPLVITGVPGVYLHGLLGSKNDADSVKTGGDKRNINRHMLDRVELEKSLNDRSTTTQRVSFAISRMIHHRIKEKAFHPCAPQKVLSISSSVFAIVRSSEDGEENILCCTNVTMRNEGFDISLEAPLEGYVAFYDLLSREKLIPKEGILEVRLEPYQVRWLKGTDGP